MKKLVYGIGTNDADYKVKPRVNGKHNPCPYYLKWKEMLRRIARPEKFPQYVGVKICDEWLAFSNFKSWMEKQDWHDKELDKDIINQGARLYSPETCAFVDKATNSFFSGHFGKKSDLMTGVDITKSGRYTSKCRNPFTRKKEYLGIFNCETDAHSAWVNRKAQIITELAKSQTDKRISSALINLAKEISNGF